MILRRLENSRFSEVVRAWDGDTAVVIGCGPSLRQIDVERVGRARAAGKVRCVAVNDGFLWAGFADAHYAADSHWHGWMTKGIGKPALGLAAHEVAQRWREFRGQKCTIQNSGANVTDDAVHMLRNRDFPNHGNGLSADPQALVTGRNSGFQAVNLAILAGATMIVLLGFDATPGHFHGGHLRPTPEGAYPLYVDAMDAAKDAIEAAGVDVVNCCLTSAIKAFRKVALESVL